MTILKAITWNHSRGYLPVVATAQRYMEKNQNIEIIWDKRSLKDFGNAPIDTLAEKYDLIVLDHPSIGFAYEKNILLPLQDKLGDEFIKNQKENSVGKSFESYTYNEQQLALAIDAAAPIAFYNESKMNKNDIPLPKSWQEIIEYAKNGYLICAGNATSILMQLYMLCNTKTKYMFTDKYICETETMKESLHEIKTLFQYLPKDVFNKNPIGICEWVVDENKKEMYCPFDFGYSNYSRGGYAKNIIKSTNVVNYNGKMLKTVLGGAGIAISSKCKNIDKAIDYLKYSTSETIQKTIYFDNGGQSGHRQAWLDAHVNQNSNNFFIDSLATLDNAYLRPRHNGYIEFQEKAEIMVQECIIKDTDISNLIEELNKLYIILK